MNKLKKIEVDWNSGLYSHAEIIVNFSNYEYLSFSLHEFPTRNCELGILGYSEKFLNIGDNPEIIKKVLKTIYYQIDLTLLLIDIEQSYLDKMKKLLKPYCKKINVKNYISTNNSKMVLCLLYLDLDKIIN